MDVDTEAALFVEPALAKARIVRVERDFIHEQDRFHAVRLDQSKTARLYLVVHDLLMVNGVSMVRANDVEAEEPTARSDFIGKVMAAKLRGVRLHVPKLDECSFRGLCRWLERSDRYAAFFEEGDPDAGCQVGRVARIGPETVVLETVDTRGHADGAWEIAFRNLTRIDCLGEYERSFDLVAGRRELS